MTKRFRDCRTAARAYIKRGWSPVPLQEGTKRPGLERWTELRVKLDEVDEYFDGGDNIGILTGEPSGGLTDIDLDAAEARVLADEWLPDTELIHGRPSNPRSHYLYLVDEHVKTKKYCDIDGRTSLVEIRSSRQQTMAPPSLHPDGERVAWAKFGEPARVDATVLQESVRGLAAATLLATHWPKEPGCRNELAMALSGYLLRGGLDEDTTKRLLGSAARVADDREWRDRGETVTSTAEKLRSRERVTGGPRVIELLQDGEAVVRKLSDWLALNAATPVGSQASPYEATSSGLVWHKPTREGKKTALPLTNFTATITKEIVQDDGIEERRLLQIEAVCRDRRHAFSIPAELFPPMSWVGKHLGASAILYAGYSARDHTRVAIQMLSGEVPVETHYAHTGWREIDDEWVFLHAGGALGAVGARENNNSQVTLTGTLARFELLPPPTGKNLVSAIKASLQMLEVVPLEATIAPYAAAWRVALGGVCDLSVFIEGKTGVGKSQLAALAQQHFGPKMNALHLPASWSSTENALEAQACEAKNVVLVIDDFSPTGSRYEIDKLHGKAERVLRAQGNRSGRMRMAKDTSLRPVRPPRGLIVATGEDVPRGSSLRSRLVVVELAGADMDWSALTRSQHHARAGLYSQAMAGFVQFTAPVYGILRKRRDAEIAALRKCSAGGHRRIPTATANLAWGLRYFLVYAIRSGAISEADAVGLWERWWLALQRVAAAQEANITSADPVTSFLEALAAAVASGDAHVAAPDGEAPEPPEAWGWTKGYSVPVDDEQLLVAQTYRPRGRTIGWKGDDGELYLEPSAAHSVTCRMTRDSNGVTFGKQTVRKRLDEAGLLLSKDDGRLTIRKMIQGKRRPVLHLPDDIFESYCSKPRQLHQGQTIPPLLDGLAKRLGEAQVLSDVQAVCVNSTADWLATRVILAEVNKKASRARKRLTDKKLAEELGVYGVEPSRFWDKITKKEARGYNRQQIIDAWDHHLEGGSRR